jgi:hypothetical protein
MDSTTTSVLKQIDTLLSVYSQLRARSKYDDLSDLPESVASEAITRLSDAIERLAPDGSRYRKNAQTALSQYGVSNAYNINILLGILRALREDYSAGFLQNVQELVHADVFSDFHEMAEYLLSEGYKDPAAVIAGGVVEEHLRKLCTKNSIATTANGRPKKADAMNSELAAANAYSKLDQKSVTAWLDLRNKAAHGQYAEYSKEQVNLMLLGHREFMARNPA